NLYLDCNGIIHRCAHPETLSKFEPTEEELILNVISTIDRLVRLTRPN
ncbi:hypothetical protein KIPB_014154, partial [Kipferlia bialata]